MFDKDRKQLDREHENVTTMIRACEITGRDLELSIEEELEQESPRREIVFELELRIVRNDANREQLKARARKLEAEHDAITGKAANRHAHVRAALEARKQETHHAAIGSCADAILQQLEETHANTSAPGRLDEELENDYRPEVTSPDGFPTGAEQADRPSPDELDREGAIAEELERS
jgi:hypothetical protein